MAPRVMAINLIRPRLSAGPALAAKFIHITASEKGRRTIHEFGRHKYGQTPCNAAAYARKHDD